MLPRLELRGAERGAKLVQPMKLAAWRGDSGISLDDELFSDQKVEFV